MTQTLVTSGSRRDQIWVAPNEEGNSGYKENWRFRFLAEKMERMKLTFRQKQGSEFPLRPLRYLLFLCGKKNTLRK